MKISARSVGSPMAMLFASSSGYLHQNG